MDNSIMEKLSKEIIDGMYRYYNFNIEDFSLISENHVAWGLSKTFEDGTKNIIHFISLSNGATNESYENSLCAKFKCKKENIITVVLVYESMDSTEVENHINQLKSINAINNNTIVLELQNKRFQVFDNKLHDLANQMARVVENNKIIKDNKMNAVVTYAIIGINIVMFIISAILSNSILNIDTNVLVNLGAKYNPAIEEGQWFRLITCMFLHGGLIHIAANMYSLYSIGPFVERLYGRFKYVIIYFVSGIISSSFSFLFSNSVSIGASGAIFGLLGVVFVFAIKERKRMGKGFLANVSSVVIMNLIIGLSLPGIDNYAHLGGLLGGITFGAIMNLDKAA